MDRGGEGDREPARFRISGRDDPTVAARRRGTDPLSVLSGGDDYGALAVHPADFDSSGDVGIVWFQGSP